ncbi:hypothetical protein H4R26_002150 [Coemansia thaxteri]|uniref:Uncharacterized protein n=1 Tax=Coemansia thaxteri TaxID=2663907 RepID=A0A9W8BET9_9FUNG|nr:hypothetical protein H4R26_002150 [Coemansia thaxteri]
MDSSPPPPPPPLDDGFLVEVSTPAKKRGRGRPRKSQPLGEDTADRPIEDTPPPTPLTERRRRGRPRKVTRADEDAVDDQAEEPTEAQTEEQTGTPERRGRGRPRKASRADEDAADAQTEEQTGTPERRGRGRPRKASRADEDAANAHTREQIGTPERRGRGRPRKTQRLDEKEETSAAPSPAGRGLGRRPRKAQGLGEDAADQQIEEARPTPSTERRGRGRPRKALRLDEDGADQQAGESPVVPLAEGRRPEPETPLTTRRRGRTPGSAKAAASAEEEDGSGSDEVREEDSGSDEFRARIGRPPKAGSAAGRARQGPTKVDRRRQQQWAGPQAAGGAARVDVGLDRVTWEALRALRVDGASMAAEADADAEAEPPAGEALRVALDGAAGVEQIEARGVRALAGATRGWACNTGLACGAVDWAPGSGDVDYVAVGGAAAMDAPAVERDAGAGVVQVWRVDAARGACGLAAQLAHAFGRCVALRWAPVSAGEHVIGLLAAVFGDGHLRVCAVPADIHGADVRKRWPAVSLVDVRAPHGVFTALAWAASDLIVGGTSTGGITAWVVGSGMRAQHAAHAAWPYAVPPALLASRDRCLAPVVAYPQHAGPVLAVAALTSAVPPDADGFAITALDRVLILSLAADGRLQAMAPALPARDQHAVVAVAALPRAFAVVAHSRALVYADSDNCLRLTSPDALDAVAEVSSHHVMTPGAAIQDIAVSDFHPYVAVATSEGALLIENLAGVKVGAKRPIFYRRIYSLLWRPADEEGEHLVCEGRRPIELKPQMAKRPAGPSYNVFPVQTAVLACAWSRNPRSATWIASISASGLLRIEDVSP